MMSTKKLLRKFGCGSSLFGAPGQVGFDAEWKRGKDKVIPNPVPIPRLELHHQRQVEHR